MESSEYRRPSTSSLGVGGHPRSAARDAYWGVPYRTGGSSLSAGFFWLGAVEGGGWI